MNLQRGSIIFAEVKDPSGQLKRRPAMVLSTNERIAAGGDLVVAGISTKFSRPPRAGWFELPAHPRGHMLTGLDQQCVVKSNFLDRVPQQHVLRVLGRAPAKTVEAVLKYLDGQRNRGP